MGRCRIGILGQGKGWHTDALADRIVSQGHEAVVLAFDAVVGSFVACRPELRVGNVDLFGLDCVIVRSIPAGSLEQVILRVDCLHRLERGGVGVLNPARAIESCVDKYLTAARLVEAGLPTPTTYVCERADDAWAAFESLGRRAVVKPLFGAEGRGVMLVEHPELAYRTFRTLEQMQAVALVQEFIPTPGYDVRAFVLGGEVIASMRRWQPAGDFRANVTQGGRSERVELDAAMTSMAVRSAAAVGAVMAGVDLMPTTDGRLLVLEVNSSPGFRALSASTGVDVAAQIASFAAKL
jgi:ribosomal protein S6--L-glutamate ligase